ncbi:cyclopropane-fatty-acyl-phospholipid synthase family protein [Novosphingobium sp. TH158]|uniref:SAM-dependent methyltransferase n=1 Tax=Novosphingobium sp. TH158 TaxID=2067455 RepID=UPI000C7ADFA6|nr:cyclopropane-fatty-acyl-phospholipid synthase family protein [Novosphingobium sp. TH158]PLK26427.1 SAM-dependent methyltransferase [Novosphingobium sp. TH158]
MWLLDKMLRALVRKGRLVLTDHDGREYAYGEPDAPALRIRLTDKGAALHIARDPRVGTGEAYMDGRLVIEPPHDVRDFILFIMSQGSADSVAPRNPLRRLADRIGSKLDQNNYRARARQNVEHHYDLTRRFYELFLDSDRQYTMAYWRDAQGTLEQAQLAKKALIAAKLRIEPGQGSGMRVLDIGSGWGGFGLFLNRHYGCEVLGVSLAPDQVRFANERAQAAGVADEVKFELIDYRDVNTRFDRIASVGMFEHVGLKNYDEYFAKTWDLLEPDGVMLTHTIGRTKQAGATDKWNRKYIFPGHYLPAASEMSAAIERTGWEISDLEVMRYHYALTLAEWYRRTTMHREEIEKLYDARFFRMWQFYLAGAEQGFRHGNLVNFQFQTVKRRDAVPMTRDYIEAEMLRLLSLEEAPEWHLERQAAE